jgi:hypothetical protein
MSAFGDLAPYLVLVVVGFLPNEVWRIVGLVLSHGIDDESEIIVWVRAVATAILTGVVGKLVVFAPGSLGAVPIWVRLGALALGMLAFVLMRRSVLAAVMVGTAAVAIGMLLFGA